MKMQRRKALKNVRLLNPRARQSIAREFLEAFNAIPYAPRGDLLDGEALSSWRACVQARAVSIEVEGHESYDPEITYVFEDGSWLFLANPEQEAFCAWARVIRGADE